MAVLAPSWVGNREDLVDVILHDRSADMVVKGGRLVNVYTREIYPADVAIKGGRIAIVGDVDRVIGKDTQIIDARGRYLTPGLIDTHLHSYHSYVALTEFARSLLAHGTTTYADAFYGQAIVSGMKAVKLLLNEIRKTPLKIIFLVPILASSSAQNRKVGLSPSPEAITLEDMMDMLAWPECFGLEEPQPFPVIEKEDDHVKVYRKTLEMGKVITGHAAGLTTKQVAAYIAMGTSTDHESEARDEALEKARFGMRVLARQGSGWAPNVQQLVKAIYEYHIDSRCFSFSVDVLPPDYLGVGDIDEAIRVAVSSGVDPVTAVQMATLNAAETFRIDHEIGSITPGRIADIVLVDDIQRFQASMVIANGRIVAEDGHFTADLKTSVYPDWVYKTVQLKRPVRPEDFEIKTDPGADEVKVRAIQAVLGSIITPEKRFRLKVSGGVVQPDLEQDVIRITMVDRFNKTGGIGNGYIHGLGLEKGAFGITVNSICENVLVAGVSAEDVCLVVNELARIGGGMVLVDDGKVVATVELRLFGLMSDEPLDRFLEKVRKLTDKLRKMGWKHESPSVLEFMGVCGDVAHLKISDQGLLDVDERRIVDAIIAG